MTKWIYLRASSQPLEGCSVMLNKIQPLTLRGYGENLKPFYRSTITCVLLSASPAQGSCEWTTLAYIIILNNYNRIKDMNKNNNVGLIQYLISREVKVFFTVMGGVTLAIGQRDRLVCSSWCDHFLNIQTEIQIQASGPPSLAYHPALCSPLHLGMCRYDPGWKKMG